MKVTPHFSVGYRSTMVVPSRRDDRLSVMLRQPLESPKTQERTLSIIPPGRTALSPPTPTLKGGATFAQSLRDCARYSFGPRVLKHVPSLSAGYGLSLILAPAETMPDNSDA
jgi:hypothetical protein